MRRTQTRELHLHNPLPDQDDPRIRSTNNHIRSIDTITLGAVKGLIVVLWGVVKKQQKTILQLNDRVDALSALKEIIESQDININQLQQENTLLKNKLNEVLQHLNLEQLN